MPRLVIGSLLSEIVFPSWNCFQYKFVADEITPSDSYDTTDGAGAVVFVCCICVRKTRDIGVVIVTVDRSVPCKTTSPRFRFHYMKINWS